MRRAGPSREHRCEIENFRSSRVGRRISMEEGANSRRETMYCQHCSQVVQFASLTIFWWFLVKYD